MLIETFNKLGKSIKGNGFSAYIPDKYYANGVLKKTRKVVVYFTTNGKAYEYSGTIQSIAERLDLIPDIETTEEQTERVYRELVIENKPVTTCYEVLDDQFNCYTENCNLSPINITTYNRRKDDYGRKIYNISLDYNFSAWTKSVI